MVPSECKPTKEQLEAIPGVKELLREDIDIQFIRNKDYSSVPDSIAIFLGNLFTLIYTSSIEKIIPAESFTTKEDKEKIYTDAVVRTLLQLLGVGNMKKTPLTLLYLIFEMLYLHSSLESEHHLKLYWVILQIPANQNFLLLLGKIAIKLQRLEHSPYMFLLKTVRLHLLTLFVGRGIDDEKEN